MNIYLEKIELIVVDINLFQFYLNSAIMYFSTTSIDWQ